MSRLFLFGLISFCLSACSSPSSETQSAAPPNLEHVIVLGFDGLSPDGLQQARTPHFDQLIQNGASTMTARAVLKTSSGPNWASMICGAGPEQHGITHNGWKQDDHVLPAMVQSQNGWFPSIFQLIRDQRPTATQGAIYHWGDFGNLFDQSLVDLSVSPESEEATTRQAIDFILAKRPEFTFVHLDHVDGAGHAYGHGSPEYYRAVEKADSLLGVFLLALEENDLLQHTLLVLSSDHGGIGNGHGGETLKEMEIPFILHGPGVKPGYQIEVPVNTTDNAATVAWALGLDIPYVWTGKPVKSAFVGQEVPELSYQPKVYFTKPIIYPQEEGVVPAGGLFIDSFPLLRMENPNASGIIRYTLDGSSPTSVTTIFQPESPVIIDRNTVVKAAVFDGVTKLSRDAVAYFRILESNPHKGVRCRFFATDGIEQIPDLAGLPLVKEAVVPEFRLASADLPREEQILVEMTTKLDILQQGQYTFWTNSDDGSKLYVNGAELVNNDGNHGVEEASGTLFLRPGRHEVKVIWYNAGGGWWLDAFVEGPAMPKQIIPASRLYLP